MPVNVGVASLVTPSLFDTPVSDEGASVGAVSVEGVELSVTTVLPFVADVPSLDMSVSVKVVVAVEPGVVLVGVNWSASSSPVTAVAVPVSV